MQILADPLASRYIDGVAVHWYADWLFSANRLTATHNAHPNKFILPTEACNGYLPLMDGPSLGNWERGEHYGRDIIEDLENWAVGWTDWNLCLDTSGGPSWARNFVDSAVLVNATADEFYKQPMFYVLGHFSKFIQHGCVRVGNEVTTHLHAWQSPKLSTTAWWDQIRGRYVLVMQNRHGSNAYEVSVTIPGREGRTVEFELEPHSIATMLWAG